MLEILRKKGVMGTAVKSLTDTLDAKGLGVVRQTVHKWLDEEIEADRVVKASYGRCKAA